MFQNLAKYSCTCRATASLTVGSSLSTSYASRRFYVTGGNRDIVNLLNECIEKEESSITRNQYKVRSFKVAVAAVEKLNFEVRHGDELKTVKGIGPGIRDRINVFLGHKEAPSAEPSTEELFRRDKVIKEFMAVSGLGKKVAEVLYDAGCDTVAKLHLQKYNKMLAPRAKRSLKYLEHSGLVPRESAEAIVEFCKNFMPMDGYEIIIAGDYRRGASAISEPIELLIIDKSALDPIPTPPHPSALMFSNTHKPTRTKVPFSRNYLTMEERAVCVLLNKIIRPLEDLAVVSDTVTPGRNVWRCWVRVPGKRESWESKKERVEGIKSMDGIFHRVNITYIPEQSRGSALLALTGDRDYYLDCKRKAVQAGLYLNEWGLWEWEPDSKSLSRFQTSDAPYKITSLGAIWGSETEADRGRWVRVEATGEEEILNAIGGEYVPPNKRNFGFITGKVGAKQDPATMDNP